MVEKPEPAVVDPDPDGPRVLARILRLPDEPGARWVRLSRPWQLPGKRVAVRADDDDV